MKIFKKISNLFFGEAPQCLYVAKYHDAIYGCSQYGSITYMSYEECLVQVNMAREHGAPCDVAVFQEVTF